MGFNFSSFERFFLAIVSIIIVFTVYACSRTSTYCFLEAKHIFVKISKNKTKRQKKKKLTFATYL